MTITLSVYPIRRVVVEALRMRQSPRYVTMSAQQRCAPTLIRNHPPMQQQHRMSSRGGGNYRWISSCTHQLHFVKPQHYDCKLPPTLTLKSTASSLATETETPSSTIHPEKSEIHRKPQDSSLKKSSVRMIPSPPPLSPKLLQLRDPVPRKVLEESFEDMALQTELAKLNLFVKLKNKLVGAQGKKLDQAAASVKSSSPHWDMTQEFLDRQKTLPPEVKTAFWNLILAPTSLPSSSSLSSSEKTTRVVPQKDVDTLMEAREVAIRRPIFWNDRHKHQVLKQFGKDKKDHKSAVPEYRVQRHQQLLKIHEAKSQQQRHDEATAMAQLLSAKLPPTQYKKLFNTLQDYVRDYSIGSKRSPATAYRANRYRIQDSYSMSMYATAKEHIHHIAQPFVQFLYLTVGTIETKDSATTTDTMVDVLSYDPKIESKIDNWNYTKENVVTAMQTIQSILLEEHEKALTTTDNEVSGPMADDQSLTNVNESASRGMKDPDPQSDDSDEWTSDEEEEEEEDLLEDLTNDDENAEPDRTYDDSDESVTETFMEVSRVLPTEKEKKKVTTKARRYIAFEAISIGGVPNIDLQVPSQLVDKSSKTLASVFPAPTDRLIFIDNLPIDVTEETLTRAYSRCGPIESIQIFNQRPDLDPGRKSDDSKKKIRKPSSVRSLWERPRTPLYATILYRDADGARKATVDALRIFGMVLDKHLIRSHLASNMTKLYLEDMPAEDDVTSLEAKLSQVLHPNLYVCLDVEQRRKKRFHGPSNCVVLFPDFASTFWAFSKLSADLPFLTENDECQLHWMPTPGDAELYWTRKLNY